MAQCEAGQQEGREAKRAAQVAPAQKERDRDRSAANELCALAGSKSAGTRIDGDGLVGRHLHGADDDQPPGRSEEPADDRIGHETDRAARAGVIPRPRSSIPVSAVPRAIMMMAGFNDILRRAVCNEPMDQPGNERRQDGGRSSFRAAMVKCSELRSAITSAPIVANRNVTAIP